MINLLSGLQPAAARCEEGYDLRRVELLLGLSRAAVRHLVDAGFVTPDRGERGAWRFSFRDLILLRTAHELRASGIAPRRIVRALSSLRARLPASMPLSGLRISAVGSDVTVIDREGPWEATSGQRLIDFEVTAPEADGELAFLPGLPADDANADACYERALEAEAAGDAAAAEAAYREAIEIEPDHLESNLNLGAMLCESGRPVEAVALYESAVKARPLSALMHFNHAVALEDVQRPGDALAAYRRCLELRPDFADAHYNAGCLLERSGDTQGAVRHFSAYRRIEASPTADADLGA